MAEIALTIVLLAGAGLLIHSFVRLVSVDPGFETKQILTFRVNLPGGSIQDPSRSRSFYDRLRDRIRTALGAQPGAVVWAVVRWPLGLVAIGVGLGTLGALAVTRVMASLLYEVSPTDPTTFVSVVLILVTTAIVAGVVPARRAAAVDPVTALRHD